MGIHTSTRSMEDIRGSGASGGQERAGFLLLYAALVIRIRPLADRERRLALERELADYSPAARGDLEAILDRYSDGDTSEMRDILSRQAVATRDNGVPGIGRLPVNPR